MQYHAQRSQRPGNYVDASGGCMHMQTNRIDMKTAVKSTEDVSIPPNKPKLPNSPGSTKTRRIGAVDGSSSHVDALTILTGT